MQWVTGDFNPVSSHCYGTTKWSGVNFFGIGRMEWDFLGLEQTELELIELSSAVQGCIICTKGLWCFKLGWR